jgi:3,4-dihydroxy 2-butanone 4-phosphate synthase/GTP cyclohydrolase II
MDDEQNRLDTAVFSDVERVASAMLPSEFGEFRIVGYRSSVSAEEYVAIVKGEIDADVPMLVRVHSQCLTGDVFHSLRCDCGRQLQMALARIEEAGRGVLVYQQQEGRGIGILNKIRAYALQDQGQDTVEANLSLGFEADHRSYGECARILLDLGVRRVLLMSNNPQKLRALEDAGLEIVDRVVLEIEMHESFSQYLRVKKEKLGHLIDFGD